MNFGLNSAFFYLCFAVSVVLHSFAAVILSSLFATHKSILQYHRDTPKLNVMEVTFSSLPSRQEGQNQNLEATQDNHAKHVFTQKKTASAKATKRGQQKKYSDKMSKSSEMKPAKYINHQAVKKLNHLSPTRPDEWVKKVNSASPPKNIVVAAADIKSIVGQSTSRNLEEVKTIQSRNEKSDALTTTAASKSASSNIGTGGLGLNRAATGISSALPPLLKSRQPDYPEEARWEERTGKTTLKFQITDQGRVVEPQVSKSSGHRDLDMAAMQAILFWRFNAKNSQTTAQWYQYSFRFELN